MVIGPFINASAILLGGMLGALLSQRLPERIRVSMTSIFGLASLALKCSRWSTCFQHSFWQCRFPPPGPPGLPDNVCNSGKVMIDCAVCSKLKKFD